MHARQIQQMFTTLRAANPQPASELAYSSVFELLAAVLLSAQATDVSVNKATRRLFPVATSIRWSITPNTCISRTSCSGSLLLGTSVS